jgi:3-phenylpropionate/trans-cinnamate dioxygenase ferredoxin reductase subunit
VSDRRDFDQGRLTSMQKIVVVGGSLAGLRCAQALRRRGYAGELVIVSAEAERPYDRPPLSKQLLTGAWEPERLFFDRKEDHAALQVEWLRAERASGLDVAARRLMLASGTQLSYDGLVIATGARPRTLAAARGLAGVFTLRTLADAAAIARAFAHNPRLVVIGAGFIGLEVAASARARGLSVTVIEPQAAPLLQRVGPLVAAGVERLHVDHGVQFRFGVSVRECQGSAAIERILLSDGSSVAADLVVVGIGVEPETRWLVGSGVAVEDGVLCDATLATNVPDIVAAGDVVRWPNGQRSGTQRIEHWSYAVESAQAAAARLLDGPNTQPFLHVPYFWSDHYDVKLQCAGRTEADDELAIVHGTLSDRSYVALYGRAGRLVGVLASNSPAQFLRYRRLVAAAGDFAQACALESSS